ncbi:metallophosphoesterase [Corallococcus exiguus]|uniref:metallophosphoesterase n=1 Tax=Corallococcus TaxID=83461 RepID=UPI000EC48150|nr:MULTISPECIES: metallophosphoesterase [Corallococcus]NNC06368.1 metallophosphoesterase [Corallococcus exiguus]NPC49860.1 metallophosphoesterase [Corallococcus exiguus]RKH79773.1 metallophosphoesterase [Corallococcus sp. AB032C]
MPLSAFSLLIALGAVLGHLYLFRRLVWNLTSRRGPRLVAAFVLGFMTLVLIARRYLQRTLPEAPGDVVELVSYSWMGVALCLVLGLAGVDLGRAVFALGRRLRPAPSAPSVDAERRRFLSQATAGGALALGGGLAGYGSWRAFTAPEVTEVVVRIPKLPRSLDGFSIVQLTDLHVGPFIQRRFMDELVRRANALNPDLVAITGDLVDGTVPRLGGFVAALGNLHARYGSFFVTGNHDYSSGAEDWVAHLGSMGIPSLRNRHVRIGDAGGTFDLVGVDDWHGGRRLGQKGYDLDLALADRDPERAAVLLAHQPANFKVAAERGVDLQISGHTHGGQLFPMTALIGLSWEHSAGHYRHGDSHIYVSRGCGFWGPPMRLGSPPELVKLVLTS